MTSSNLNPDLQKIIEARHHDPFSVLGKHSLDKGVVVRAYVPNALEVTIAEGELPMKRIPNTDLFEWRGDGDRLPDHYRLIRRDTDHRDHIVHDPYSFLPQLPEFDLHLFGEGKHWHAYRIMGSHPHIADDVGGILFAVWAPGVERVSVVGDFNRWDGRCHPMRVRGDSGVWRRFFDQCTGSNRRRGSTSARAITPLLRSTALRTGTD